MLKCTQTKFTQTSPSAFFRRTKRPYTVNDDEDRQISDSDISQKLQLILISLREQSAKETRYFTYKTKQLESQVNEQNNIISILQAENKLLRSHVELYVEKYGGLGKILGGKWPKTIESDVEIEEEQEQNDNQKSNNECCYLKVEDVKSKISSGKSTHYKSSFIKSSQGQSARQQKRCSPSSYIINSSSQDCKSLAGSSSSNFYKKKVPFHHRRQSSLQKEESKQVNILPVMSQFNNKSQQFQLSEISCRVDRKDTFVNRLRDQEESSKESEDQQASRMQQVDCLGLESKGSGFFSQKHRYEQDVDNEETLLIQNYQSKYDGYCEESIVRYVESIDETQQQNQLTFDSTKTDSDIRRMGEALEAKFGSQNQQLEQDYEVSSYDNTASQQLNLKELHHSYFKTLDIFQKRNQQSNNYQQISGEKRLKALFSPLPQNLLSKKITLPVKVKNVTPIHNGYRESRNVKCMVEHFSEFDQKKLLMRDAENPLEMAVKRLKEGNKLFGMR